MNAPLEHPDEEIRRLQRCINDLVSVLALPAIWTGSESSQVVRILLDALLGMLRLDLVYVRLNDPFFAAPLEMVRCAPPRNPAAHEIGEFLRNSLGEDSKNWPPLVPSHFEDGDLSIVSLPMGMQSEMGTIVAGSRRPDFPNLSERLVLSVAANQAAIGLQEALLLSEQKRVAGDLDRRVAQRTKELAEASEELQLQVALLQLIPVAAWTVEPDGTPNFVNQIWLEYTGQTLEHFRSSPEAWLTAIHPEDRERTSRSLWEGIRSGQGFTVEARFRRARDGTYHWHLNRAVPLRDAKGKVVRFVGTSTDIDDVKRSQEDLRTAEEKNRLIIDTALDAVVTMNAEGTVTSWNKQAEIIFGWNHIDAVGRRMSDLIIPERERAAHERGLRHFLVTGEGPLLRRRVEVTAVRRGGVEFPVELEVMPMRLGQEWVFSAFVRDITDSKRAQEELRRSELNLRQMTETIPEMLWSATAEGAVDYCNARVLDYTGFSAEEIMDKSWKVLLHSDDVDQTDRAWRASVATGAPYRVEVRTFHAADRTYRWCVTSALPLLDQQGRILKWYGTIVDMHDRKRAEEALRARERDLSSIINTMPMLAWSARPDGFCDFLNQRWLDFTGLSAEQACGWGWGAAIHPDDVRSIGGLLAGGPGIWPAS